MAAKNVTLILGFISKSLLLKTREGIRWLYCELGHNGRFWIIWFSFRVSPVPWHFHHDEMLCLQCSRHPHIWLLSS